MSPQRISSVAAFCLLLILVSQAFLINDYFQTTRAGLIRESDAILYEAFREELNQRNTQFKHLIGEDTIKTLPRQTNANTVEIDIRKESSYKDNLTMLLNLTINKYISKTVPPNIDNIDAITNSVIKSRNISSEFVIKLVNTKTGKVQQSKRTSQSSLFQISSKPLPITFDKQESI